MLSPPRLGCLSHVLGATAPMLCKEERGAEVWKNGVLQVLRELRRMAMRFRTSLVSNPRFLISCSTECTLIFHQGQRTRLTTELPRS
jgi:hypothetical protein